jgi:ribosomal protein S18 acetylase RimI-like enzyme
MIPEHDFVIEEVQDIASVWSELTALYLESENYSRAFRSRTLPADWEQAWGEQMAPSDDRLVLVARKSSVAVGYLVAEIVRDFPLFPDPFGYLRDAFVLSEMRSQGAGRLMLAHAEAWCRNRGAFDVRLDVWAANSRGLRFWTLAGFEVQSMTMKKTLK